MKNRRLLIWSAVLVLCIPFLVFWGMNVGPVNMSPAEVWDNLWGNGDPTQHFILVQLRLPRILLALVCGGLLTLGGLLMQALVKNPLADPYIMGLSAGAGFGANLRILGLIPLGAVSAWFLPVYAFFGALLSLGLLLLLGYKSLYEDSARLLIAGIAISSLFTALTGYLIYSASDATELRSVIFWSLGSFNGAHWEEVWISFALLLALLAFTLMVSRSLDLLALGDRQAGSLGMNVARIKILILVMTALCVGGSIAFTGPIGFVGLMIPHFTRGINGMNHRSNAILGTLLGGVFLCACDLISQLLYPPAGLPIGILTAILGVPFFLYLLFYSKYRI